MIEASSRKRQVLIGEIMLVRYLRGPCPYYHNPGSTFGVAVEHQQQPD